MRKLFVLTFLCVLVWTALLAAAEKTPSTYTIQIPPQPNYSSIDWLVGNWVGKMAGKESQGQVLLSVSYELGKRFLLIREEVSLFPTKSAPATHESLMGILSADSPNNGFNLTLYSSNGFVTRYRAVVKNAEIDFNPEGGALPPPGWLFRRVLIHTNPGQCTERVDVAPPGKSFFTYYTADLHQVASIPANPQPESDPSQKSRHHHWPLR
ncbi:MAG TPA: hypothetical protein VKW70_00015 [Terriglobia bacterium]|nr:hypothetical protein [Terriglobia bacterium]